MKERREQTIFVIYGLLFNDVVSNSGYIMSNDMVTGEHRTGTDITGSNTDLIQDTTVAIASSDEGKPRGIFKLTSLWTWISTRKLLNRKQAN